MTTLRSWTGVAALLGDAACALVLAPLARALRLVDDAHNLEEDTDA